MKRLAQFIVKNTTEDTPYTTYDGANYVETVNTCTSLEICNNEVVCIVVNTQNGHKRVKQYNRYWLF